MNTEICKVTFVFETHNDFVAKKDTSYTLAVNQLENTIPEKLVGAFNHGYVFACGNVGIAS